MLPRDEGVFTSLVPNREAAQLQSSATPLMAALAFLGSVPGAPSIRTRVAHRA